VALIVAAFPPMYFTLRLRKSNPAYARLAGFLVAAVAIHAIFHVTDIFVGIPAVVLSVEALSAAFILIFAAVYWKLREEG
jgi:heme A synthase